MSTKIQWLAEPEEHDYPAAENYLSLITMPHVAAASVANLRKAPMSSFKAKDIFRASKSSLLGVSNSHVKKNLDKIAKGEKLSPILLVRFHHGLVVADGYHRLCAVYSKSEDAVIPCKIV
jgi:disulfide oxidoreductase YuzD